MTTSSKQLQRSIRPILSPKDWMPLQDIYSHIADQISLDADDLRSEVGNAKQRAWQRNIRNVLRQLEQHGEIERAGARYRLKATGKRTCECCRRRFSGTSDTPQPPRPRTKGKRGHCKYCYRQTMVYDQPKGYHDDECHFCWAVYARLKKHPALQKAEANPAQVARKILSPAPPPFQSLEVGSLCSQCQRVLIAIEHHEDGNIRRQPRARLLNGFSLVAGPRLTEEEAEVSTDEFIPEGIDRRVLIERQIRARRGQQQFRDALRVRYGDCCVLTACRIVAILEAAHISPYRGDNDNHPENGLLLRADIHTLFDLNLLGIEPSTLRVALHPAIATEYGYLNGERLSCPDRVRLSRRALETRYEHFCNLGTKRE